MQQDQADALLARVRAGLATDRRISCDAVRLSLAPGPDGLALTGEVPDIACKRIACGLVETTVDDMLVADLTCIARNVPRRALRCVPRRGPPGAAPGGALQVLHARGPPAVE